MTSSPYKKQAADRRDKRHTKDEVDPKPVPSKKDTKKWCKGKEGVEHKLDVKTEGELKQHSFGYYNNHYIRYCTKCGKVLEQWSAIFIEDEPPEWVKEYLERLKNGSSDDKRLLMKIVKGTKIKWR